MFKATDRTKEDRKKIVLKLNEFSDSKDKKKLRVSGLNEQSTDSVIIKSIKVNEEGNIINLNIKQKG